MLNYLLTSIESVFADTHRLLTFIPMCYNFERMMYHR